MVKKEKYHFKPNQVKLDVINFLLKNANPVSEPEILQELKSRYGEINQSNVNRPLHWLHDKGCVDLEKKRSNIWSIKTIKNLEKILNEFPELIEFLQNSEAARKIVIDTIEDDLVSSTNFKKTKEYKEQYDVIKEDLLKLREDLDEKFKISSSFFKLCIRDEFSLDRNLNDLLDISDDPTAKPYIGYEFIFFKKSSAGIDLLFKSCIAIEIMERKLTDKKDMKNEIEYIKRMNNTISENQLNKIKKYYEKLTNETKLIKQMEKEDPDKHVAYLKNNYKKFLKAPGFIKWQKFVSVKNEELQDIENEFEYNDGEWDYLKDEEGPA